MFYRFIFLTAALSLSLKGSLFSERKVLILDPHYAIVVDTNEWVGSKENDNIRCSSKNLPISFQWFTQPSLTISDGESAYFHANKFLSRYAEKNKVIFQNLRTNYFKDKRDFSPHQSKDFVIRGSYFDENKTGQMAFYILNRNQNSYFLFVKSAVCLDDQAASFFFKSVLDYLTPLVDSSAH